jgi:hypothetical protein
MGALPTKHKLAVINYENAGHEHSAENDVAITVVGRIIVKNKPI